MQHLSISKGVVHGCGVVREKVNGVWLGNHDACHACKVVDICGGMWCFSYDCGKEKEIP